MNPLFKKVFNIGKAIVRGVTKGAFPGVAGAIDAVRNIQGQQVTVLTTEGKEVTGTAAPHSWWSIIPSLIVAGVIIYGLWSKQLDVNTVVDLLKEFFVK